MVGVLGMPCADTSPAPYKSGRQSLWPRFALPPGDRPRWGRLTRAPSNDIRCRDHEERQGMVLSGNRHTVGAAWPGKPGASW